MKSKYIMKFRNFQMLHKNNIGFIDKLSVTIVQILHCNYNYILKNWTNVGK